MNLLLKDGLPSQWQHEPRSRFLICSIPPRSAPFFTTPRFLFGALARSPARAHGINPAPEYSLDQSIASRAVNPQLPDRHPT